MGEPQAKSCSRCGDRFECGIEMDGCWCTELPALTADRIRPDTDCLCPRCLQEAVDALPTITVNPPDE